MLSSPDEAHGTIAGLAWSGWAESSPSKLRAFPHREPSYQVQRRYTRSLASQEEMFPASIRDASVKVSTLVLG